jgi:hypothetical protein
MVLKRRAPDRDRDPYLMPLDFIDFCSNAAPSPPAGGRREKIEKNARGVWKMCKNI